MNARNLAAATMATVGIALLVLAAFDWVGYAGFTLSLLGR